MDINMIMKMLGVDPGIFQQLMALKSKLELLPKEKQSELVTNFVNSLEEAIKEMNPVEQTETKES